MVKGNAQLLKKGDSRSRVRGLKLVLQNEDFALLPAVHSLIAEEREEIAQVAREVSLELAKKSLNIRGKILPRAIINVSANIIKKYDPEYVSQNLKKLEDEKPEVIIDALIILKHFVSEKRARLILENFVKHESNKVRATAAFHIGMVASKSTASVLTRYLEDTDNRVKANTIEVLEQLDNKSLIPVLSRFKRDLNNRIRANALKALHTIGEVDVYDDLKEMFADEAPLMRTSAVWVVGEIGLQKKRYIELLKIVQNDEDELLQKNILVAIKKIGNVSEMEFLFRDKKYMISQIVQDQNVGEQIIDVAVTKRDLYMLVGVRGRIVNETILPLKLKLNDILKYNECVVIDLAEVNYINSSGLGLMINISKSLEQKNGLLFICNCNLIVAELFQLSKLDQMLNIFPTETEIRLFLNAS